MKKLLRGLVSLVALTSLAWCSSVTPALAQAYDPTKDPFASNFDVVAAQCTHWVTITPSDTVDLAIYPKAIYVGTGGDVKMIGSKASSSATGLVWKNVPTASMLPARPRRVLATGTTATDMLGCY